MKLHNHFKLAFINQFIKLAFSPNMQLSAAKERARPYSISAVDNPPIPPAGNIGKMPSIASPAAPPPIGGNLMRSSASMPKAPAMPALKV